ncbi:MAG: YlbF family regulator [Halanaerobiaceae bacterium]
MSLYGTANRLAREIKNSDEYTEYQEIREKIMANESTKEMLQDYMQKQMRLQQKQMSGQELSEEEKNELENLKSLVDLNNDIQKYLQAEYRMSVMLNDLQEILFGDLEIGILNEEEEPEEN